jgi:hypothetical protein
MTMIRAYAMYNPLRIFVIAGVLAATVGLAPMLRFLWFYLQGDGAGHLQSLVIGGALLVLGVMTIMLGALADLVGRNRLLLEQALERLRAGEEKVGDQNPGTSNGAGTVRRRAAR